MPERRAGRDAAGTFTETEREILAIVIAVRVRDDEGSQ